MAGASVVTHQAIAVTAAPEPLLEVRGPDWHRLAWHIGNRHTPCQIERDRLLIQPDHVIADMLTRLGARVDEVAEPFTPEDLAAMAATLVHRGPDDEGVHVRGPHGLAFRRLSIIDVAGGHQPLLNESGDVALVLNGEIYNFRELRHGLDIDFTSESDTEVLLRGYREWGEGVLERLSGMDPPLGKLVELRFFAGLTLDEAAAALGVSRRTVQSEWARARSWLEARLGGWMKKTEPLRGRSISTKGVGTAISNTRSQDVCNHIGPLPGGC